MLTKPMGIDIEKPVEKMNRQEILFALAKEAIPSQYQRMVTWPTQAIRKLLAFYKDGPRVYITRKGMDLFESVHVGIDFAQAGSERTVGIAISKNEVLLFNYNG